MAAPASAATSTAVVSDPTGDNGPGLDPRGDVVAVEIGDSGTTLTVRAATRTFEAPTSTNWEGFALGDPFFITGTGIQWLVDVNGDDTEDYVVSFLSNGSSIVADVTAASDPSTILCHATPTSVAGSGYSANFPAGCVGNPGHVRVHAAMIYETPTDVSVDDTDWTAAVTPPPPAPPPPPHETPQRFTAGYWMVGASGSVYAFGHAHFFGGASTFPVTHLEPTPLHGGYWIVNAAGQVFAFGNAHWRGNAGALSPGETVSSLAATPTANGYWLVTSHGRVLRFGDARFFGDMSGRRLNGPVVGAVATPTGLGYYMVASDGGIFAFGDARFRGSMGGTRLNNPVIGLVPTLDNRGYWLVASDGGVFSFNAPFGGSMAGVSLNQPVVGMVRYGNGYLMVASDGGVFDFSDTAFVGSLGSQPPAIPIVGVGAAG